MNVGDVRFPFLVGPVRVKPSVEQILVLVELPPQLLSFSAAADFRQQSVPLLCNGFCKGSILLRSAKTLDKSIMAVS